MHRNDFHNYGTAKYIYNTHYSEIVASCSSQLSCLGYLKSCSGWQTQCNAGSLALDALEVLHGRDNLLVVWVVLCFSACSFSELSTEVICRETCAGQPGAKGNREKEKSLPTILCKREEDLWNLIV